MKQPITYKSEPASVHRIYEIHEHNELNESGHKPTVIKKEEEVKKKVKGRD